MKKLTPWLIGGGIIAFIVFLFRSKAIASPYTTTGTATAPPTTGNALIDGLANLLRNPAIQQDQTAATVTAYGGLIGQVGNLFKGAASLFTSSGTDSSKTTTTTASGSGKLTAADLTPTTYGDFLGLGPDYTGYFYNDPSEAGSDFVDFNFDSF